ncbi:hypothetical protein CK203_041729 [Vitis vinifera]|uniref:Uncharacterized protein n=1 Tax=Vitis vinifera TaxID=29760 RepID=A0A438HCS0_VITVI|nr:hypothetical protein CK203_041729 [Vitis vinifera]
MLRDHNGIVVRVFSKLVGEGLAIRAEILALLEDLLQTRTLDLSNLQVEGGSAILLTQVAEVHGVVTTGSGVHDGMITGLGAYGGMITGLGAHDGVITRSIWIRRNEVAVKGTIIFDAYSTITLSPVNFQYWDPQKKDYFLCAETPGAARAWVSTLHATQLVLKAHKEAVNSLSGNGSAKLGTVATVVAAANSTALECSKEIEAAMQISMRNALGVMMNKTSDGPMDDLTIMKACCYLETRL